MRYENHGGCIPYAVRAVLQANNRLAMAMGISRCRYAGGARARLSLRRCRGGTRPVGCWPVHVI